MSVYFCNEEAIDLDVIRLMGVSVKSGDNPIGYFGTGLKFAISTLIRNRQTFKLTRNGVPHVLGGVKKLIRGEEFEVITLDGDELGFTTQLGKNWEVWQAYREIHSNCLDEEGVISDRMPSGEWGTVIEIYGDLVMDAYVNRSSIFLEGEPIHSYVGCDIHAEPSPYRFYRGIRVGKFPKQTLFGYNMNFTTTLTEDRTLRETYSFDREVAESVEALENEAILTEILTAPRDVYESDLTFGQQGKAPSELFKKVCADNRAKASLNLSAIKYVQKHAPTSRDFEQVELNRLQEIEVEEALVLLVELECELDRSDFYIVQDLGPNTYGMVREGAILIDKKVLDKGVRFIASTLYEEWLHKVHKYRDESRQLQSMLFEKLLFFVDCNRRAAQGASCDE